MGRGLGDTSVLVCFQSAIAIDKIRLKNLEKNIPFVIVLVNSYCHFFVSSHGLEADIITPPSYKQRP